MSKIGLYIAFAVIAIGGNIAGQDISLRLYPGPYPVPVSILVGTGVGLIVKYLLDKRFVFRCTTNHVQDDAFMFSMYAAMGLITTSIFWGVELLFEVLFHSDFLRYAGGIIGLILGYSIKYRLDQQYVFGPSRETRDSSTAGPGVGVPVPPVGAETSS